ncbi:MAG TPA: hypothetical protein VFF13_00500 [archaeon]|nr:hypothetical protein [archaeon]
MNQLKSVETDLSVFSTTLLSALSDIIETLKAMTVTAITSSTANNTVSKYSIATCPLSSIKKSLYGHMTVLLLLAQISE